MPVNWFDGTLDLCKDGLRVRRQITCFDVIAGFGRALCAAVQLVGLHVRVWANHCVSR